MAEPTPPAAGRPWRRRVDTWWPPVAAFLAVLIGVPLIVLGAAYAIAGDDDLYTLGPTESCLEDAEDVSVSDRDHDVDVLARTASGGALRVRFDHNGLVISFGENEQEAERRQRRYLRVAGGTIPVQDLLERQQNVVLLWEQKPSEEQRELVDGCLS